jgi:hypothetical protein
MTQTLDLTKLSPPQLALLQKAWQQLQQATPVVGPDLTKLETHYVCWGATPHASTLRDMEEADRVRVGDEKGTCPTNGCGAPVGHGPAAINGHVVLIQHQAALRAGEASIVSIYHDPATDLEADAPTTLPDAGGITTALPENKGEVTTPPPADLPYNYKPYRVGGA